MPEKYTYLLVDFICVIVPLLASFHPRLKFYREWKHFVGPCLVTAVLFLVWDIFFTRSGIWSFNPRYLVGMYMLSLPLEEYLFFLCIPYAGMFTYYCMALFLNFSAFEGVAQRISWGLVGFLSVVGLLHLPLLYTSLTFLVLAALVAFLTLREYHYMPAFFASFLLILIPFFISNGILTGTGLSEPVVRYNNHYNLNIRLLTIPVEDVFYGMLLLLMNVAGFEYLRTKSRG